MRGVGLLVALFVVALLLFGSAFLMMGTQDEVEDLVVLDTVPDFSFTERSGRPFGRADLLGSVSVVDFIFTRCKGPCPIMAINMSQLYTHFDSTTPVQFVSISVDPEHDSLGALQQYATAHGVTDNRWSFLWAPLGDVVALCEDGFKMAADDLPGNHSTRFVLLDQKARIRGYYSGTNSEEIQRLQNDIATLVGSTP